MAIAGKILVVSSFLLYSVGGSLSAQVRAQPKLWIGIGVSKPVYELAETDRLTVSFVVVNDGVTFADPEVGASHLFVNGAEPRDWNIVINNGIRTPQFTALPPGEVLSFAYQLGPRYFATPGIYVLRWQLGTLQTAETTSRVLPRRR